MTPAPRAPDAAAPTVDLRCDWTLDEILELLERPLLDLVEAARAVHRRHHDPHAVQCCSLLSIKTGACPEDCAYCPQSGHHQADLAPEALLDVAAVREAARSARAAGASRLCMGAAWRDARGGEAFERVLEMVRVVAAEGLEVCATLGMLDDDQARRLGAAGLTSYNHNLDTSPEYYAKIITTRTYEERLDTLRRVRAAGLQVCCGGILGLGESLRDRARLLEMLASMDPHPESVPINMLVRVQGTPLADAPDQDVFDLVRMVAAARILMPASRVRLSAGRTLLSREAQALCFLAGANSIFFGEKLLTTPNPPRDEDLALLEALGLQPA